jgi:hypothetical protein
MFVLWREALEKVELEWSACDWQVQCFRRLSFFATGPMHCTTAEVVINIPYDVRFKHQFHKHSKQG